MITKISKKLTALAMCALIAVTCAATANAAGAVYSVPEIDNMQITLPDDMSAVTLSSGSDDKNFSLLGIDYNSTMQRFKDDGIYLLGMDSMSSITVTVAMTETEESLGIQNYNLLRLDKLNEVEQNFLSQNEYTAGTVDEAEKDVTWLYFNTRVSSGGKVIEAFQANTVYNGKSVSVTLQRNGGNVTEADYETFKSIVSSVKFSQTSFINDFSIYIIIGVAVLSVIIIILIIVIIRHAKRRRRKSKNDKIIEELADKYAVKRTPTARREPVSNPMPELAYVPDSKKGEAYNVTKTDAGKHDKDEGKYSDAEIEAILGEEDAPDFTEALPKQKEERAEEAKDDTTDNDYQISEYFEDELPKPVKEAQEQEIAEETEPEETEPEEKPAEASDNADNPETVSTEEATAESENDAAEEEIEEEPDEDEEYFNDEVLVRQDAKRARFNDSDDFFDEAPKKTVGVISGKEIEDAEEYDVIGEVEKRVSEVEKETPATGETVVNGLKKAGGAIKSFFVHCGYFVTNLSREIKRSRAKRKHKKAEEERRRRARERAARQRAQQRENGLVQVRSRDDRRPSQSDRQDGSAQKNKVKQ